MRIEVLFVISSFNAYEYVWNWAVQLLDAGWFFTAFEKHLREVQCWFSIIQHTTCLYLLVLEITAPHTFTQTYECVKRMHWHILTKTKTELEICNANFMAEKNKQYTTIWPYFVVLILVCVYIRIVLEYVKWPKHNNHDYAFIDGLSVHWNNTIVICSRICSTWTITSLIYHIRVH